MARSPLVTVPDRGEEEDSPAEPTPLVLEYNRLYLWCYRQYESELAASILNRASQPVIAPAGRDPVPLLQALTAAAGISLDPDQQKAVLNAANQRLTVISGGPGTGKTTIIFFILNLLRLLHAGKGSAPPRTLLLAPTGKAAARLTETVHIKSGDDLSAGADPTVAKTIHRALGFQRQSPTVFRYRADNPLAADLVVVDEASMVDIALMSKLFAAVPADARLILLGDKDQLASVEAGSILGDICQAASGKDKESSPLSGCVVNLERGFRFDPDRGIGALTGAIRSGEPERVLTVLRRDRTGEISCHDLPPPERNPVFKSLVVDGFKPYLTAKTAEEALELLAEFRLLCAHRRGREGVENLNRFCRDLLAAAGCLRPDGPWYKGRPIMIRVNDYSQQLFNGDLGVIWDDPDEGGELRAFFPASGGRIRSLLPGRLPGHETAFAMTIHKSQGSEFKRVAVVLPREPSPILTRELLYTAVSRARSQVHLFAPETIIAGAVSGRVTRASGLAFRISEER
ncbi:exodeoxyribonuclease V subunit alpha [Desulfurivibrio sp. D14AmB]|uniref:exodeoxyribonuclease V subunit alpha n=1 Tax=Desulfurivibrio sp. D14AmB TaxID=3374370 RepID=UPI00376EE557